MPALVASPEIKKPPAGLIKIGDVWHPRRYGLVLQRELRCIFGHVVNPGNRVFEVAVRCNSCGDGHRQGMRENARCDAHLYIFNTRGRLVWAMDITEEESRFIDDNLPEPRDIVRHFGVGFPIDLKILRQGAA